MRQLIVLTVALVLSLFVSGMLARTPAAQVDREAYEACRNNEAKIVASDLPSVVEPGRCDVEGRVISDNGVGSALPEPGTGVYAEAMTPASAQELVIWRYRDGTIELGRVGDESSGGARLAEARLASRAKSPNQCSDRAYADLGMRVDSTLSYYFKRSTTPGEISPSAAERAIRNAGRNVTGTKDGCGMKDVVPAGLSYAGNTKSAADLTANGACGANDGRSEVSFGKLPRALAVECRWFAINNSGYDSVRASDIKLNKSGFQWTTRPNARSCKKRYDVESVVTHERGHTFGLGHVSESRHGNLTMSTRINGPCQNSERSLGRGDVLGLENKYR